MIKYFLVSFVVLFTDVFLLCLIPFYFLVFPVFFDILMVFSVAVLLNEEEVSSGSVLVPTTGYCNKVSPAVLVDIPGDVI